MYFIMFLPPKAQKFAVYDVLWHPGLVFPRKIRVFTYFFSPGEGSCHPSDAFWGAGMDFGTTLMRSGRVSKLSWAQLGIPFSLEDGVKTPT